MSFFNTSTNQIASFLFMSNCNQSRLCLLEHQRTDKPDVDRRLWRECLADSSSEVHGPLSRSSYPACFYACPITLRRPSSRQAWRCLYHDTSIWWNVDSTHDLGEASAETPTSMSLSLRDSFAWHPSRASAFWASSTYWDHDVDPCRLHWLATATGNHIRACMTSRPDNSTSPLVLRSAGGASGVDERIVCVGGGQNGASDHWQWTCSMWQQPNLSYAVVKVM